MACEFLSLGPAGLVYLFLYVRESYITWGLFIVIGTYLSLFNAPVYERGLVDIAKRQLLHWMGFPPPMSILHLYDTMVAGLSTTLANSNLISVAS